MLQQSSSRYIVFLCRKCGYPNSGRDNQKTHKCPNCGFTNNLTLRMGLRIIAHTDSADKVTAYIQYVKMHPKEFPIKKVTKHD